MTTCSIKENKTNGIEELLTMSSTSIEKNITTSSIKGNKNITNLTKDINGALYNVTDTHYGQHITHSFTFNVGVITVSVISIVCCIFSIWIITRCQKMPLPIKYLSLNLLACFFISELFVFLFSMSVLFLDQQYYFFIFDLKTFLGSSCACILWCSVASVTYERLIVLLMPITYVKYATRKWLIITIVLMWFMNILVPATFATRTVVRFCSDFEYISLCDIYTLLRPVRMVLTFLIVLYGLLIIVAYIKIVLIIFHHGRQTEVLSSNKKYLSNIAKRQTSLTSTKTIAVLIFAFVILQSPTFSNLVVSEFWPALKKQKWQVMLQYLVYIASHINMYVSLYLYIWKFKECKMKLFQMFSKCSNIFQQRVDTLRIDVYSIVTIEHDYSAKTQQSSV